MINIYLKGKYKVETSVDINAPVEQVWAVIGDFTNVAWAPSVTASHPIGRADLGVGAGRHCALQGFGEIDEYITQWSEGQGFVYNVSPLGPLNNGHSSWWIEKVGENSRVNIVLSYDLRFGLFGRLLHALVMRKKLKGSLPQTASAIKTRVEGLSFSAANAA
ncbi:SRPBCC family protein [Agarivorans aestuarii]|uniref:SRPBCC family protein n=1 Tax=Agarivorans aestuarii TaxID=1563703 RepID=A0ABU7G1W9_9ALTE|nr:SRPBCC family protein [Agarivorans aestuarii]MEE1673394.1 SRPBCC family protein [Agarivorans aestuarii]